MRHVVLVAVAGNVPVLDELIVAVDTKFIHSVVIIQGWMYKRGEFNTGYKRRYFILKGNLLYYMKAETDKVCGAVSHDFS